MKAKTSDILGNINKKPVAPITNTCCVCSQPIDKERINALKQLDTSPDQWTHVKCASDSKIKGIYMGEIGTSELKLVNKIYNDTVRSVFTEQEEEPE